MRGAIAQQLRQRDLHRRGDGEEVVGDQFQCIDRSRFAGTADADPSQFVVRQSGGLRQAAEGEGEDVVADERRSRVAEREGMEDLVGDDRHSDARDRILLRSP